MFEVSEKASEAIKQFLEEREGPQAIRILLMADGGWEGPHLVLALDGQKRDQPADHETRGLTWGMT